MDAGPIGVHRCRRSDAWSLQFCALVDSDLLASHLEAGEARHLLHLLLPDPDPEEAIGDKERTVVSVNQIPIQQTLNRSLRIRSGSQAIPPDETAREGLHSRRFGGQSFQEPLLVQRKRFPKGRIGVAFAIEQNLHARFNYGLRNGFARLAKLPKRMTQMLCIEGVPFSQFTDRLNRAVLDDFFSLAEFS